MRFKICLTVVFHPHHVETSLLPADGLHLLVVTTGGGDFGFGPQDLTSTPIDHASSHEFSRLRPLDHVWMKSSPPSPSPVCCCLLSSLPGPTLALKPIRNVYGALVHEQPFLGVCGGIVDYLCDLVRLGTLFN